MALNFIAVLLGSVLTLGPIKDGYVGDAVFVSKRAAAFSVVVTPDSLQYSVPGDPFKDFVSSLSQGSARGYRSPSVLPCLSCVHRRDAGFTDVVVLGNAAEGFPGRSSLSDGPSVFGCKLFPRAAATEHAIGVKDVLGVGDRFKVFKVGVGFVPVFVVYHMPLRDWPFERLPDKAVNPPTGRFTTRGQPNSKIPIPTDRVSEYVPGFCSGDGGEATDAPQVGHFVGFWILSNGPPSFFFHGSSVPQSRKGCTWL